MCSGNITVFHMGQLFFKKGSEQYDSVIFSRKGVNGITELT